MSKGREIDDYLSDILNACAEVEEFTRGMEFDSLVRQWGQASKMPS
jgi:uncharacterized protein with HEPN domain